MELRVMSPVWNAERLARLRELVAEGLSSTAIGAKLGLTRNAVCGARNRHGIPPAPEARSAPRRDAAPADRSGALRRVLPRSAPERFGPVRDPHPVGQDGVPLLQLEWWMCRWPLPQSHGSAMRFCGQPAVAGDHTAGSTRSDRVGARRRCPLRGKSANPAQRLLTDTPRDGAIFGDLIGKLDLLRIECAKCGRSGRYRLADLLMRYGRNEKVFAFTEEVTANCTRKQGRSDSDPCGAICPDLPEVV